MSGTAYPRELIRASAGTGKTFQISSSLIGLLAAGVAPERILASTFTRKAAGEILDRVLVRLARAALEPEEARRLGEQVTLPGAADATPMDPTRARELLEGIVRELHRLDIGTLDAFFVRLARTFTPELGLPLEWSIAEESEREETRSEAVQAILERGKIEDLLELLSMVARGDARRRVHDALVEDVDELRGLLREIDPGAPDPWSPFREVERVEDAAEERVALADRLAAVEAPVNKDGSPNAGWVSALESAAAAVRDGRWEEMFGKGPGKKFLDGEAAYNRRPFPPGLGELLEEARTLARAELVGGYDDEAKALGEVARLYDESLAELQWRSGGYRFGDITYALGGPNPVGGRPDLDHRLDRRSDHLLLDEFQDTSLPQWTALEPIADGISRRGSLVVVADSKQSIYGWRNADPGLVDRVGQRYGLASRSLRRSWRSSPVVLGFVNRLFGSIADNPVLAAVEGGPDVARSWEASFEAHEPAPPLAGAPGRVTLEVGPADAGRGTDRPRLMARAAERLARIHARAPGADIGVLVHQNRTVARLIHELRLRGVRASEEGGTSVDDAAPVSAVLALLQLADHPGDTIARYHVAAGPLGALLRYEDHRDSAAARRLAAGVRRRLLRDGYGTTLSGWTRRLAGSVNAGELRRLEQLVELGFRWDGRATLRPGDFVRFVHSQKVEDPLSASVRVMTVHQAKGLEFDVVVLPELDVGLTNRGGEAAVPERDPGTGRIRRVFPYVARELRPLFPELETAYRQRAIISVRDDLGWLYVAVTRARYALHLLIAPDEGPKLSTARTFARLVRAALDLDEEPAPEDQTLLELGDPEWYRSEWYRSRSASQDREAPAAPAEVELRVDPSAPRTRILARMTPSDLEGGGAVDLGRLLRLDTARIRLEGSIVHRWCEHVRWIEDGLPEDARLEALARDLSPQLSTPEIGGLLGRFHRWMERPEIRRALSHEAAAERAHDLDGPGVTIDLSTERRFACRVDQGVVSGSIDRLVLFRRTPPAAEGGRPAVVAADVLDFKTDALENDAPTQLAERTAFYRPQLETYRRAVADLYGLDLDVVRACLVFLAAGVVRDV